MDELYFKAREKLSSALSEVPLMRNSLEAIRNELYSKHYEISAPPPGPHGLQCNYVLDATLNIRGALRCLADIIQRYDQSQHALNFVNVVNELLPEGYTTLREKYAIIEFLAQH